ncbi:MAG: PD40 domain-containing protein [Verrucomicrobiales bacterium]|nr:PD40 domain-containing protein [Verrucomicrobiales bacterium]
MDIVTLRLAPDGAAGELRRITDDPGHDSHVQYSPDGDWLVFTSECAGQGDEWPLIPNGPQSYGEIYALRLADQFTIR